VRSDIRDDKPGEPLVLTITVIGVEGCAPLEQVAVTSGNAMPSVFTRGFPDSWEASIPPANGSCAAPS
jgi:hypothetical protein